MLLARRLRFCYSSDKYKQLRVYKKYTLWQLVNALMVNRAAATPWLVAQSHWLYKTACKLVGSTLTNKVVEQTFGKVFTAGKTLDEVENMSKPFQAQNIPVIIDFCGQGFIDEECVEAELDNNAQMFRLTAQSTSKHQNQMISIKVSGLVDMRVLKKLNNGAVAIDQFWQKNSTNGELTGQALLSGLQKIYGGVAQDNVSEFVKVIFGHAGDIRDVIKAITQFKCDEVDFKMKVHPYYIDSKEKNDNSIIHLFCPVSKDESMLLANLVRRINLILDPYANNTTNFRVIVDAEQSYIQRGIFSISEQYQMKFNKDRLYIIPTLQNYLKISPKRVKYELELAKRNNLYFALKLVRGAYLVQQTRIANQKKVENPVVDSFQMTTKNFMNNVEQCMKTELRHGSQLLIGSHNNDTIEDVKVLMNQHKDRPLKIEFAQLLGLADHLTIQLKRQGFTVYKYLPYGPTPTMVPYLIRRAQELSQMKYPLVLQYDLIKNQFSQRWGFYS